MTDTPVRYLGGLAADDHGKTDDRPPLVLLHGLTYDRRQWEPLLDELAAVDPGRRVVAFDLPGHGESPRRDVYDLDEVADTLHVAILAAGLDAPVVVGHSLGGVLATRYATTYPVRGAVNVDQPLLVGGFGDLLRRMEPTLRGPEYGQVWDAIRGRLGIDRLPPAARELVETATTPRQDLFLGYWHEILATPAGELDRRRADELAAVAARGVPYHYVTGAEPDPAYRAWLQAALPDLTITVLTGAGHFVHLSHPAPLAHLLTRL